MRFSTAFPLALLLLSSGCNYVPDWLGGGGTPEKKLEGNRFAVIAGEDAIVANKEAQEMPVFLPDPVQNAQWRTINDAMEAGSLAFAAARKADWDETTSASVGEGEDFAQGMAPAPVIAGGKIFAMDASGAISAHDAKTLQTVWENTRAVEAEEQLILGGGLHIMGETLYVSTGYGRLLAMDVGSGKTHWKATVGAPVRGAPAVAEGRVIVQTADNQTLAFDAGSGTPQWQHRGIRENAGYFSMISPVVSEGVVVSAYSSGELFGLRLETGTPIWADSLVVSNRTSAAASFSGINANPIVQEGVVYAGSSGGVMIANALLNGRGLWQNDLSTHTTPWSAGGLLFTLSANQELLAIVKRDGRVRWVQSLRDNSLPNYKTPVALFAPVLLGNTVVVLNAEGEAFRFDAGSGKPLPSVDTGVDAASAPIVANGALYVMDRHATLHRFE